MKRLQRIAWVLILIVDMGYIAWGAGAAASPNHLLGPGGTAILPAGYEGYSGSSWPELARAVWYPGLSAELREDVFASVPDPLELGLKRVTDAVSSSVPLGIGSSYSGSCTFGVRD